MKKDSALSPSPPMNYITDPQVGPRKAGELHYYEKFIKHVNLFMSEWYIHYSKTNMISP